MIDVKQKKINSNKVAESEKKSGPKGNIFIMKMDSNFFSVILFGFMLLTICIYIFFFGLITTKTFDLDYMSGSFLFFVFYVSLRDISHTDGVPLHISLQLKHLDEEVIVNPFVVF
jgi:hypothetical protein